MSVHFQKFHKEGVNRDPKVDKDEAPAEITDERIVVGNLFVVLEAKHTT